MLLETQKDEMYLCNFRNFSLLAPAASCCMYSLSIAATREREREREKEREKAGGRCDPL
jgi:hypothetical protein